MSNTQWSLDNLYTSYDSVAYKKDCETFECCLEELTTYCKTLDTDHPVTAIEGYIERLIFVAELLEKLEAYSYLKYYANTYDMEALKHIEDIKNKSIPLIAIKTTFLEYLANVDELDTVIKESVLLNEHQCVLKELKEASQFILSKKEEELIEQLKATGSDLWAMLRQKLTSTLMADYEEDGEHNKLSLGILTNKVLMGTTTQNRAKAYKAEIKAYKEIEESVASALNGIKGEVITISKIRGYNSPLEMSLMNARMDKPILDVLMSSIQSYLPWFQKYLNRKSSILGYTCGLPYYEMLTPIGKVNMHYTYEEACQLIIDSFTSFSMKLGNFAAKVIENNWIDVEPRNGKWNHGAFCWHIHSIGESRILSNFTGTLDNVRSLAHEIGHAYHNACLIDQSILNAKYPKPLAETASIFCEQLLLNKLMEISSKSEKIILLDQMLAMESRLITDKYSQYLFETELFARRAQGSLSVEELYKMMINAQEATYKNGLVHPTMWLSKNQLYLANDNYYNFPYLFGMLFAKGLYREYMYKGEEFVLKYDALLTVTGSASIKDILNMMDIDAYSPKFYKDSLELIKKNIELFIQENV